ncbi:AAA family ATPase [Aquihabitans sp. G128]|uniref:ATP-dependent DNA helicase n=1 Tax=Aquihabitans sp. G128 TaxID=2849779 RepID=UPI001C24FE2A|nr:AAA family ATPase [Aquihabitans sp. G128]QXC60557.1 AAA family ATPase [Aquihabitans sp. G128]
MLDGWWERARAHGFTPDDLSSITQQSPDRSQPADTTVFGVLTGSDGVCATTSVFGRNELLHGLAHLGIPDANGEVQPLAMAASDLQALADRFLASPHVRQLTEPEGRDDGQFTTVAALAVQEGIVARYIEGLCSRHGEVDPEVVAGAIARHPKLSAEQRCLVRSFCLSGDQLQCAIGRAGAGKTTTMAAAVDAWQQAGFKVLGAAVKGEAARTLASAAGITCETVAWHLAHTDPTSSPLDARTVLIVDEASTISDTDLDRLGWLTEQTGATLRLIGDPAQHGAVAAGGMFRVLCEHDAGTTPELTESHRLQHPADRLAVDALREGRIAEALDALQGAGHLHIARDDLDIYTAMLSHWWNAHQAGDHHPMVDRRNTTRHQLNRLAHRLLQANGEVGAAELKATGGRAFSVGDRITARTPARHLHPDDDPASYVRNGATGTVTALHERHDRTAEAITVDFDDLGTIKLPRSFFDEHQGPDGRRIVGIDLAYSLTSYAVQGATFDTSTSRIDEGANRPEAYVDTTRGRHANHLYLTRATDPLDGEHLPKAPPLPLTASITDRLARSGPQPTAWELLQERPHGAPEAPSLEPER